MCFRPSPVHQDSNMNYSECPTCGQPIMSQPGVESGECPYCGKPIPVEGDKDKFIPKDKKIF